MCPALSFQLFYRFKVVQIKSWGEGGRGTASHSEPWKCGELCGVSHFRLAVALGCSLCLQRELEVALKTREMVTAIMTRCLQRTREPPGPPLRQLPPQETLRRAPGSRSRPEAAFLRLVPMNARFLHEPPRSPRQHPRGGRKPMAAQLPRVFCGDAPVCPVGQEPGPPALNGRKRWRVSACVPWKKRDLHHVFRF